MPDRRIFFRSLIIFVLIHLVACGNKPTPDSTATMALQPMEIAELSAEAMMSVNSLHFTIERDGAPAFIDADHLLAFRRAEGDFELPDRMRAIVRVITVFSPIDIGMIVQGDEQYATDPITGEWGRLPSEWGQFNLIVLFDPETGIQRLLKDGILDLQLVESEEIDKQRHYRLVGRVKGDRLKAMTLGFIGHGDVDVEVWIGAEDFYLRRLQIIEPETDQDDPTTWDMEFSKLGQPVEIKPPPVSMYFPNFEYVNNGTA